MANPQKERRLTDQLNVALSSIEAAIGIGKSNPDRAQRALEIADSQVESMREIVIALMRAAEKI